MNASLTEYLRDLADWIRHEAFRKLPDELEEKADEVRELAQTLESGVVVVPVEEYEALVGYAEELDEIESRMGNYSEQRAAIIRTANTRLQQNGGEAK